MLDHINIGNTSNTYRQLTFSQSPFIPQLLFRVTNTQQPNRYLIPGATRSTSKVHINTMYIQYTSIDLASLLIYQVSRVILLQWLFPLLQKHLVSGLGSTLGFFTRAAAELSFHEVSLLALALLETSGFTNHQQLMLLDFYFCGVKHHEYLRDHHICT